MKAAHRLPWLGSMGCFLLSPVAAGGTPGIDRAERALQKDRRVVADRLDPGKNPGHRDDSILNAVGAVWPYGVDKSGTGYAASTGNRAATGFLIDGCHVLTNMHVVYADAVVVNPAPGHPVAFGFGQTESDRDRGALQGLKFLSAGRVVAHGDTVIVDGRVRNPAEDWAVIRLRTPVEAAVPVLTIAAVDPAQLPKYFPLSSAGYPSDHRRRRGDGFKLKDLWRSDGEVVGVRPVTSTAALLDTTLQTTAGNSGGPIIGNFGGRHLVVGMVQSIRGNGIDVSESTPNVELLFTAGTVAEIARAQARDPCR